MPNLPTGTVTFLYTDIESSTKMWERFPKSMHEALARHDAVMRRAIEETGGQVFRTEGDAFRAVFVSPQDALLATVGAQRALRDEPWGETGPLRVRMALHSATPLIRDGEYHGPNLNRVARLMATAHGGQIILSQPAFELVRDNVPPGVQLRDLGEHLLKDLVRPERIYQVVASDLPSEFPPLNTLDVRPNNLPAQPTALIGREKEIAALQVQLMRPDVRLMTLTGPGGTGKTRLAMQVAAELVDRFADGVFLVNLASVSDSMLLASEIALTIGVREATSQPLFETLKETLRDKEMLLLLDNFEQLVPAAPTVSQLLSAAPKLRVVVTSRFRLHVRGEHEFAVPPMSLPDLNHLPSLEKLTQYEAVRLFIERARNTRPDFEVNNENAPAVAEICYRLDGLPLAIELAAARTKILPPQAMLSRLQNRLKLLTGGERDLPERQQTLRGTIEWSYDLLSEDEKTLFRRLSVFYGGCTLDAAEDVCMGGERPINGDSPFGRLEPLDLDVLDGVSSLVDKSFMRQEESEGDARFVMLETLREYAIEQLVASGEGDALRWNHLSSFVTKLSNFGYRRLTENSPDVNMWLNREYSNLRAAFEWSFSDASDLSRIALGVHAVSVLFWFWNIQSFLSEGRMWAELALTRGGILPDSEDKGNVMFCAGFLAFQQGDYVAAREWAEQSVSMLRAHGSPVSLAFSLQLLGLVRSFQGDRTGRSALEEGVAIFRRDEHEWGLALALFSLGDVVLASGDDEEARKLYEESLRFWRHKGDNWAITFPLTSLGRLAYLEGDYKQARIYVEESEDIRRRGTDSWALGISLVSLAEIVRCLGEYDLSERLANEALEIYGRVADESGIAWALYNQARVALGRGNNDDARLTFARSLRMRLDQSHREGIALCIAGLAQVAGRTGRLDDAVPLYGCADVCFERLDARISPVEMAGYRDDEAAVRAQVGDEAWQRDWSAVQAIPLEDVAKDALRFADEQQGARSRS